MNKIKAIIKRILYKIIVFLTKQSKTFNTKLLKILIFLLFNDIQKKYYFIIHMCSNFQNKLKINENHKQRFYKFIADIITFNYIKSDKNLINFEKLLYELNQDLQQKYYLFCEEGLISKIEIHTMLDSICANSNKHRYSYILSIFFQNKLQRFGTEEVQKQITTWIEERQDVRERCLAYHYMANYVSFSSTSLQQYISDLLILKDKELRYYLGLLETALIPFRDIKCYYPEYYNNRRDLIKKISTDLFADYTNIKQKKTGVNKKVGLLFRAFFGKHAAGPILCIAIANEMRKRGYDVTIFVTDVSRLAENNIPIQPMMTSNFVSAHSKEQYYDMLEEGVNVIYATSENYKQRAHEVLDSVYSFNPDFIIDITWEIAVFNPKLIQDFPIIIYPLNGFSSSSEFDVYITRNKKQFEIMNKTYQCIDQTKVIESSFGINHCTEFIKNYKRDDYGIADDDFVLVSVGNRIEYEIDEKLIKIVEQIMLKQNNVKWIIVGKYAKQINFNKSNIDHKKIIFWGYEAELMALYQICDAYLNPQRSGGGRSITLFLACKKPAILIDTNADCISHIGFENVIPYNFEAINNHVYKLRTDKDYYNKTATTIYQTHKSQKNTMGYLGDKLVEAYGSIINNSSAKKHPN